MKILVSRTDKIGDLLLITPVLSALRKKFPDAHISVLVNPYSKEILEGNPNISDIITNEGKLTEKLKNNGFDAAIILFPEFSAALSVFLAGIPRRIGTGYRMYSFLFNERIYIHRSRIEKHEVEYNFDLVKPLGVELKDEKVQIYYGDKEKEYAKICLNNFDIGKNDLIIAVHPGCGGSSWNWPVESYAKLSDRLISELKAKVIVTGSENDREIAEKMISNMKIKPYVLLGKTSIKQLAAVLSYCGLFISSSTGPMHIASAVGAPTLSFFSPVFVCSPKRWGPWGNKHLVFQPPIDKKNMKDNSSMNLISVNDVFLSISKFLDIGGK